MVTSSRDMLKRLGLSSEMAAIEPIESGAVDDLVNSDEKVASALDTEKSFKSVAMPQSPDRSLSVDSDESDQTQIGRDLAAIFKDKNIHPVLVFGSKGSGKTTFLASLFRYIQISADSGATISLLDDIFPAGEERWRKHAAWARDVFYKKVDGVLDNIAPGATLEASPFFVPIKLKRSTGEEVCFAFLEGKGEWYMPDDGAEVPYKPFRGLLQGVLQHFSDRATVIYIAPFTTGGYQKGGVVESSRSADLKKSDKGLVGAIHEYTSLRRAHFHQDNHMFLMTKWDIYCGGVSSNSFYNPPADEIQAAFSERFELAWTRFQNMEASGVIQNKGFSAYCAGVIDGLTIQRPAADDAAVIDRYPRRVWDWLHMNHLGTPLYPDMQPKKPKFIDKFIKLLRG